MGRQWALLCSGYSHQKVTLEPRLGGGAGVNLYDFGEVTETRGFPAS